MRAVSRFQRRVLQWAPLGAPTLRPFSVTCSTNWATWPGATRKPN